MVKQTRVKWSGQILVLLQPVCSTDIEKASNYFVSSGRRH